MLPCVLLLYTLPLHWYCRLVKRNKIIDGWIYTLQFLVCLLNIKNKVKYSIFHNSFWYIHFIYECPIFEWVTWAWLCGCVPFVGPGSGGQASCPTGYCTCNFLCNMSEPSCLCIMLFSYNDMQSNKLGAHKVVIASSFVHVLIIRIICVKV